MDVIIYVATVIYYHSNSQFAEISCDFPQGNKVFDPAVVFYYPRIVLPPP